MVQSYIVYLRVPKALDKNKLLNKMFLKKIKLHNYINGLLFSAIEF